MPKNEIKQQRDVLATEGAGVVDGDDDIVELLDVVTPGKKMRSKQAAGDAVDFSADLDAMLGSIAKAEESLERSPVSVDRPFPDPTPVDHLVDPHEELSMPSMDDLDNLLESLEADKAAADGKKAASPKAPPPGETLDALPITHAAAPPLAGNFPRDKDNPDALEGFGPADLDALLEKTTPETPGAPPSAKRPPMEADDDLLQELTLSRSKAMASPETPPAAPDPLDDDLLKDLGIEPAPPAAPMDRDDPPVDIAQEQAPVQPAPEKEAEAKPSKSRAGPPAAREIGGAAPVPAPARDLDDLDEALEEASKPQEDEESSASRYADVDLNELDALLDDMLASAPAPGRTGPASSAPPQTPPPPRSAAGEDDSVRREMEALRSALTAMEEEVRALHQAVEAASTLSAGKELAPPEPTEESPAPAENPALEELRAAVARMDEETLSSLASLLEAVHRHQSAMRDFQAALDQKDALLVSQKAELDTQTEAMLQMRETMDAQAETMLRMQETINTQTETALQMRETMDAQAETVLQMQARVDAMIANLDKLAADAAAKVIREELAVVLQEFQ